MTAKFAVLALVFVFWPGPQESPPKENPPASQPVRSAPPARRTPKQVEILQNLLRDRERPAPIVSHHTSDKGLVPIPGARTAEGGRPLILEGRTLVERSGRLVLEDGTSFFVLTLEGEKEPRKMQLLPCELLEALERAAATSTSNEFVISAEVTRYRGANYLLLRKVLQRVGNGNLRP